MTGLSHDRSITLSVDAMGGDQGPDAVARGVIRFLETDPTARVLLHGRREALEPHFKNSPLAERVEIHHADDVVTMTDKPSHVMRNGKATSMWAAVDALRDQRAEVCVSCGNTGALMAVSMIRLRKAEGVNRPAIACLWPSRNPQGFNVMLDVGADIRADADDLLAYAMMGASYARNGLGLSRPRVGLLNVGTEEHKGRAELKAASELIAAAAERGGFDYVGFVEGGDIPSTRVDVIVTDGFTGNVALKTGEGTARLISDLLREAFMSSALSKVAALMTRGAMARLRTRIDPRQVNGGVFLGLGGLVVKSHGSADATGVAAALSLAAQLARSDFSKRLASRIAGVSALHHDAPKEIKA
ncbi:phosphate acyltransferase PlsX [Limimaricola variabilis]|uniref:phosphate acyltransferase PlsX n=1 Tax=Limimaricola variabilis TaxID=1492771 RepID=UPI002AC9BD10|nr:phosphate acyltransferase PlsX [Limimaricola variabilis]WPY95134.1 phosphate acyltransferase PlsX [Limimaricola variabilis]